MTDKKTKIKIAYVLPSLDKGGAERFITDLILNLNREIFSPTLLLFVRGGEWLSELEANDIPTIILEKRHKLDLINFWQIYSALRKTRPDIVHTQQGGDIYGRLAAKLLRIPVIVSTEQNINQDETPAVTALKRLTARWAAKIFAISEAVKIDAIKRYRLAPDKLAIIYNGINIQKFNSRKIRKNNIASTLTFGTMGRLAPQKGQFVLISAWRRLKDKDIRCLIAGVGPLEKELDERIRYYGLTDKINLVGPVSDSAGWLESLDAFVFPSLWEGLGLVLLEAGLAGLPIIASAEGGITEIIDEQTGWLVPAGDAEALAAKISWLAVNLDQPEVQEKIKNLQTKIIGRFDIKKIAADYEDWYQRLLANVTITP